MPTPIELLAALAPELDNVDASIKAVHIDLAESQTGTVFKAARNHAVALLAAHTLTMTTRKGASGSVASLKEGQLSVGFSASANTDELAATSYGAELIRLRRSYIMGARTVMV
jgi:hypothetical protein